MKKIAIQLSDLSERVRQLLAASGTDPVVIEDETGTARYGVIRYGTPTRQQKDKPIAGLRELQEKADASMKKHGKTEDDLMRELLKDD